MNSIENIIKIMYKNKKINNGMPIVAAIFDESYKLIKVESNKRRIEGEEKNWKLHIRDMLN